MLYNSRVKVRFIIIIIMIITIIIIIINLYSAITPLGSYIGAGFRVKFS